MDDNVSANELKMDRLDHIKLSALYVQNGLVGRNAESVYAVYKQFEELVDVFYNEFRDVISLPQYTAARTDYDYFMVLLESTRQHYLSLTDGKRD
jgi:hypothetical protein